MTSGAPVSASRPDAGGAPGAAAESALFPSELTRRRIDARLGARLEEARLRRPAAPVVPRADAAAYRAELAAFDFATPRPLEAVLDWTVERMESGMVQVAHPRYFGLFNPAPSFPAECADRIAANFNPQLATATTSPFPVAVEAHVVRSLARRAGLPETATGHFTSGGSEANFTALICALTRLHPAFAATGARGFAGAPRLYVSRDAHLAWLKIAHQSGIGRDAVRLIPTDGAGRMESGALADRVRDDAAAGDLPAMIVATMGTTAAGMIDPVAACADIAASSGAWLHVDAAWGGAALASDRLRPLLRGIELAQSITIDAHKWFATTMGCGIFLAAEPETVQRAFAVSMECMPSCDAAVDPYVGSAQWSRRFLGLRLFLALAASGWSGYARHVERAADGAAALAERLRARNWRVLNDPALAVLCVAPPRGEAAAIARNVVRGGVAWVSAVHFEGEPAVRICLTSGETSDADLDRLVDALSAQGPDAAG